ncbi:thiamine phosphate synthase [Opitutus sp. ER46]|uniref:thiamine phosphate synthase n=1 Tax=Opitutus sp. ER46 TaxID=2161864 RepID=UPI000D322B7C|nr:thiamine phosphate synthase [Opitutus sp. ER46]PTX97689.1 hypothetical protein DB354_05255 [Opitutus sp. ER46]
MTLVVISPERDRADELAVLDALCAAGLERYHVRKPHASAVALAAWLQGVPTRWRARLVLHQHHELAARFGLGGVHHRDPGAEPASVAGDASAVSRSCHDLATLRAAAGRYPSVFFCPVFASVSKPGHGPVAAGELAAVSSWLRARTGEERRPEVLALGGVTAANAAQALALGFDGVAVIGAVWEAPDPVQAFRELQARVASASGAAVRPSLPPLMCLTQDGLPLSHVEQATRLVGAGARLLQLRMKGAEPARWRETARQVVDICHARGALCLINDSVEVALATGADGVHLGRTDGDWRAARERLGPGRLLGGTVNNAADAAAARAAGALDYVGVGPWRFTTNKRKLAPILGADGIRELVAQLAPLPAWAIGGIGAADLAAVRSTGAAGAAVSSVLFRDGRVEANYAALVAAWEQAAVGACSRAPAPAIG